LTFPTTAARTTIDASCLRTGNLLPLGTDGKAEDIPLLGDFSIEARAHLNIPDRQQLLLLSWVFTLVVAAATMSVFLIERGYGLHHPVAVGVLAAVALAADRESIRLSPAIEVSVASLVSLFAAVVFGPLAAIVVGAVGLLADLPRRDGDHPHLRWLTWTAIRVVVSGAVGLTAVAITRGVAHDFWSLVAAVTAAFVVENLLGVSLTLVAPALRGTGKWAETARSVTPALLGSLPIQAPVLAVLAYSYERISPWSVALFLIPAVAAHRLLLLYRQQRETAEALGAANERLAQANLSFATALVATLDARDRYTAGHSAAVAVYGRDIAARMGLTEREQELVHLCGLVHDVGKIGLPAGLLEKPGALSLEERRQMEQHSAIGERILKNVADYAEISSIVRHHHERVDGNGYPDGLIGTDIPLLARIIAVADAYNAMTSDRPYRDAMPSRVARLRLAQAVESQFDTAVVAAFEAVLTAASEEYRMGQSAEFALGSQAAGRPHLRDLAEDLVGAVRSRTRISA
jgi:HD domain/ECF-type riboflavin transporter, S component